MAYTIYCHTFPNGKKYVGQTCQEPEKRWFNGKNYCRGQQPAIEAAIKKYGWENVTSEILAVVETKEEADALEIFYIGALGLTDKANGYNIALGGSQGRLTLVDRELLEFRRRLRNCAMGDEMINGHWLLESIDEAKRDTKIANFINTIWRDIVTAFDASGNKWREADTVRFAVFALEFANARLELIKRAHKELYGEDI
jgi:hypothetical protein